MYVDGEVMLAVRTDTGQDRYVASEWDTIFTSHSSGPVLLWCHGNNGTAINDYTAYNEMFRLLAQRFKVVIADLGGNTFGNDTGISCVESIRTYMGVDKVYLLGGSMGASVALNYARVNPDKVEAIACVIPALEFNIDAGNPGKANLDLAYGGEYDDENETHSIHNPNNFAASLDSSLPIKLWTSGNDPTCVPSTADEFVTHRPQTERVVFGNYGHGGILIAYPDIYSWLKSHL